MRILIVGGGEIGYALARELARDHGIFIVDHTADVGTRFESLDVGFLHGSGTSTEVLQRAGVGEADLLIACTGLDEVNMVACALATRLGAKRTICFVSKEEFLGRDGTGESLREHFGIERIVWPEAQLAEDIERIIAAPHGAIDAEAFAGGRIRLLEFRVAPNSFLTAGPVASLHVPGGVLLVAVKRKDAFEIPRGDTRLDPGDKVIVMGKQEPMTQFAAQLDAGRKASTQMVTIIGGGDVGFRIAKRLDGVRGMKVCVIEADKARGELLAAALRHTLVLHGDGTDLELLEAEEIGRSDVLVSVIDNDERNLFASLLGRQLGVKRIITRVSRPKNLHLFERVGIDVALSARAAAVASVVHELQGGRGNLLAVLEEGQATVVEITVPADYRPRALAELRSPGASIVGAILRRNDVIVPRGQDQIRPMDKLIVFATAASVARVRDYFLSS